jgi:RNA polymerase sigma-70 factor (ECF subfamily)
MLRNTALSATRDLVAVFTTHRTLLKRAAQEILGNAACAEDLVHDACLKALACETHNALEPLPYALRMVRNMAIDRYRRAVLEGRIFDHDDDVLAVSAGTGSPERVAIDRQLLRRVARELAALPERTRRVFEMCRLEGRSQREIADMFDISPTMVHFLLREALDRWRGCRPAPSSGPQR